jgi:hypothetical protein
LKIKSRAIIFVVSSLLTIGVFNYNEFESKAKATTTQNAEEKNKINTIQKSFEQNNVPVVAAVSEQETFVNETPIVQQNKSKDKTPVKCGTNTRADVKKTVVSNIPNERIVDGYTYKNIMNSEEENLADLINIANKHHATLYAIEYSDSFAMYSNETGEAIMMFSTGSRSVSVENVAILYDMHPAIKEQIKTVVDTGNEATVEVGEFESYHISKSDGTIRLSF